MGKRPIQNSDGIREKGEKFWNFSQKIFRFFFLMFFHCFIEHKNVTTPPPLNIKKKKKISLFPNSFDSFVKVSPFVIILPWNFVQIFFRLFFLQEYGHKTFPIYKLDKLLLKFSNDFFFFFLVGGKNIKAKTSYQIKVQKKKKSWILDLLVGQC